MHKYNRNQSLDRFNRPMQDIRISVIDRCNFRCTYCMPEDEYDQHYVFLKKPEWLTFGEIVRLTKIFQHLGVNKVRLTGGEPLLRPNLEHLIKQLSHLTNIEDLALTTNGAFLVKQAVKLYQAGLTRLTVSLDTLDEKIFQKINGQRGSVEQILKGLTVSRSVGFKNIKINAVILKGTNEHTVLDLVDFCRKEGYILRFIEYMDVGNCNHWDLTKVVKSSDVLQIITKHYPVESLSANYYGEVAERYQFKDGRGEIGFISSVSQPFCGTCTRLRLSTDGKLYTCLFSSQGTDLRTPLRNGASDQELTNLISKVWQRRADKYSENRYLFQSLKTKLPKKVEMFQIGG